MTRRAEDKDPQGPGGHAAERRRQFEQERGLPGPQDLALEEEEEEEVTDEDPDTAARSGETEPPGGRNP